MENPSSAFKVIDQQFEKFLKEHKEIDDRWLMLQSHFMAETRRTMINGLPIQPDFRILDLGTGFGALPLELAVKWPVNVEGVDIDPAKIEIANEIKERIEQNAQMPGDVHYQYGNAYKLPYEDHSFDLVVAWYVFQHLKDPESVAEEIYRVLRPGGFVCLIDVDDQLVLTFPDPSQEWKQLQNAYRKLQSKRGGDRHVGRKLTTYLNEAGFDNINPIVWTEAQHRLYQTTDLTHRLLIEQYLMEKESILNSGSLTETMFTECIESLTGKSNLGNRFTSNGQIIALASRPIKM